jgi:hypothetical protein
MADRIFLRLNDRLALGADDFQWILYRSRAAIALDLSARNWVAIAFVGSTRDILAGCVKESGLGDATALSAVAGLASTFAAWKAAGGAARSAPVTAPELERNRHDRPAPSIA